MSLKNTYLKALLEAPAVMEILPIEDIETLYDDMINPLYIMEVYQKFTGQKMDSDYFKNLLSLSQSKITDDEMLSNDYEIWKPYIEEGLLQMQKDSRKRNVEPRTKTVEVDNLPHSDLYNLLKRKHEDEAK